MNLEYVRMHVICRVNQAEYATRIPMAAPQEYVNTYPTRRVAGEIEVCLRPGLAFTRYCFISDISEQRSGGALENKAREG